MGNARATAGPILTVAFAIPTEREAPKTLTPGQDMIPDPVRSVTTDFAKSGAPTLSAPVQRIL